MTATPITRRLATAGLGLSLAAPWVRPARAATTLYVRTPGGVYDDIMRKSVYEPFLKETGIAVVTVPSTIGKLLAMFKSGNVELDVIDTADGPLLTLDRLGALEPIAYSKWKYSHKDDILPGQTFPTRVATYLYATTMVYNTKAFSADHHPRNWAEFWDTKTYPAQRSLPDLSSGEPPIEIAMLADGVPMDKVYPVDLDRAFRSLTKIRDSIPKFWDTGALSAQMMSDQEVTLAAMWNGRVQALIDKNAPLAIEWNQNMIQVQALGIFKGAKNPEAAQLFVDFASTAAPQAGVARELRYAPANQKAFDLIDPALAAQMSGSPKYREMGFFRQIGWWEDNRDRVNKAWSTWILG
jgi:putative spermidine/putrescine transport system substrate-binding protein